MGRLQITHSKYSIKMQSCESSRRLHFLSTILFYFALTINHLWFSTLLYDLVYKILIVPGTLYLISFLSNLSKLFLSLNNIPV